MKAHHIIGVLFVLSLAVTVQAAIYKWVDGEGIVHFTDAKPSDPATAVETIEANGYPQAVPDSANNVAGETAVAAPRVEIYVTSWCPYCKKALAFLRSNNIPFDAYDIEKDAAAAERAEKLAPGYSGIPLTVVNGEVIRGFTEEAFRDKLLPQAQ